MNKNLLLSFILELVLGAVCLGFGIYFAVTDQSTQAVVFLVVGAVCFVIGVRSFMQYLKLKKDSKEHGDDESKQ